MVRLTDVIGSRSPSLSAAAFPFDHKPVSLVDTSACLPFPPPSSAPAYPLTPVKPASTTRPPPASTSLLSFTSPGFIYASVVAPVPWCLLWHSNYHTCLHTLLNHHPSESPSYPSLPCSSPTSVISCLAMVPSLSFSLSHPPTPLMIFIANLPPSTCLTQPQTLHSHALHLRPS